MSRTTESEESLPSITQPPTHPPYIRWAGTILAVGLLVYLLSREGWKEIGNAIQLIDGWRFIVALGLVMISRLAVAGRWHVLMYHAGTKITLQQSINITFAGLFASNFLPTTIGGDVIRLAGALHLGFNRAISISSLVVDRLVGMAGMAMALPFALPVLPQNGTSLLATNTLGTYQPPLFLATPVLAKLFTTAKRIFRRFIETIGIWLRKPLSLLEALGFTWVHMLCTFGQVWLLLDGMKEDMPIWLIGGLWAATYFVTLLPISINGMGVQELSMAFFFTRFGDITQSSALTLALLMRALQMLASLPGALTIPGLLEGSQKK